MINVRVPDILGGLIWAGFAYGTYQSSGLVALVIVVIAALIGWTFVHERIHWGVGKVWSDHISFNRIIWIVPREVNYEKPMDIPTQAFRILGIAPFFTGLILALMLLLILGVPGPRTSLFEWSLYGVSLGLILSISESDIWALKNPDAFQRYACENDTWDPKLAESYLNN